MRKDIVDAIKLFVETGQGNVVPVHSRHKKLWRLKVNRDWRVLFHTQTKGSVEFIDFGDRKEVYRNLR